MPIAERRSSDRESGSSPARKSSLSPTGYRVDHDRRIALQAAMMTLRKESLQAVIDHAVVELLSRLESDRDYRQILQATRRADRRHSTQRQS